MASFQPTIDALFRRGVPQDIAISIAAEGLTFGKLQQMDAGALKALGLERRAAELILDSGRPPVATDVVARLMHECRRICCVCRERGKSLVLHHTKEWAQSHSHDEQYLVVICANCHGEAHTTRELGRNLTPEELLRHRAQWAKEVAALDAKAFFDTDANRDALGMPPVWDYFNHRRISRTAADLAIDPTALPSYMRIAGRAPLDQLGAIDWPTVHAGNSSSAPYIYHGDIRNADGVYRYFAELLMLVVSKSEWADLASIWSPKNIKAVVPPGRVALLTAGFRFKSANTMSSVGPGQDRDGYYRKDNIRLRFRFDGWETTSTSSRGNLRGIWRSTAVCIIRSVETEGTLTTIETTCLGIGTGFGSPSAVPVIAFRDEPAEDEGQDAITG